LQYELAETSAMSNGIYLKCDNCGATIGGEQVTPKKQGIPPLNQWQGQTLRELASGLGWTQDAPDTDFCPGCTRQKQKQYFCDVYGVPIDLIDDLALQKHQE
jgi:hypothetical protein